MSEDPESKDEDQQVKKIRKAFIQLEPVITFKCVQNKALNCFPDSTPCPAAPCPFIAYKFGTHKQIIKHFLRAKQYSEANKYFQDLLTQFPVSCDLDELRELKRTKTLDAESMPIGCKLFVNSDRLDKWEEEIFRFKDSESPRGKDKLQTYIGNFKKTMIDNLNTLEHLALDARNKLDAEILSIKKDALITSAQIGDLKLESMEMPIHKTVKEAIEGKPQKSKKKPSGIPK